MSAGYYVCASAGPLHVALDGASVASVDAGDESDDDVPVLCLADHLGVVASARTGGDARRVALQHDDARVHLLVGETVRVRRFPAEAPHPLPAWVAALEQRVGVAGVLLEDPELFLILDVAALVRAAAPKE